MFSIFLPVRNGMPYLRDCVASILAQRWTDFELVVLDNASTDGTAAWLGSIRDPRVRVSRSERSLSIVESWARVMTEPKRRYMTLIGHDDLLDPGYLEAIAGLIAKQPEARLFQTGSRLINADGATIRPTRPAAAIEAPADYLRARFLFDRDVFGTGYMMTSADYERVGGIPSFERLFFSDDALWLEMMRGGVKAYDPAELFSVRIHPDSESASLPSAWRSILKGLREFNDFLHDYVSREPTTAGVVAELGPAFQLAYHRNALIFALVEASAAGRTLAPEDRAEIEQSLATSGGGTPQALWSDARVRAISLLNAFPTRGLIGPLWTLYHRRKARGRG